MYSSIFFYSITYYLLVIFLINYLKSMLYTLGFILISSIIITIFNYFNLLSGIPLKIIMLLIPIIGVFIGSLKIGKVSSKKGYVEGIKYGTIWMLLMLIINLITKNFTITSIIYYIILLLISAFAGVIGINKRKN